MSCKSRLRKSMVSSVDSTLRSRHVTSRSYALFSTKSINSSEELLSANPNSQPPENNPRTDDDATAWCRRRYSRTRTRTSDGSVMVPIPRPVQVLGEIVEALEPNIKESRMERFRRVVSNRSYSLSLVIDGGVSRNDFINVSATLRSAEALGFQSVHVVCCDGSKRFHLRGGLAMSSNHSSRGISEEALRFLDLHCSIPMNGMVDSSHPTVAAGIFMHHAVYDKTSRLGSHGGLTLEAQQILLAKFSLRHGKSSIGIAHEFGS